MYFSDWSSENKFRVKNLERNLNSLTQIASTNLRNIKGAYTSKGNKDAADSVEYFMGPTIDIPESYDEYELNNPSEMTPQRQALLSGREYIPFKGKTKAQEKQEKEFLYERRLKEEKRKQQEEEKKSEAIRLGLLSPEAPPDIPSQPQESTITYQEILKSKKAQQKRNKEFENVRKALHKVPEEKRARFPSKEEYEEAKRGTEVKSTSKSKKINDLIDAYGDDFYNEYGRYPSSSSTDDIEVLQYVDKYAKFPPAIRFQFKNAIGRFIKEQEGEEEKKKEEKRLEGTEGLAQMGFGLGKKGKKGKKSKNKFLIPYNLRNVITKSAVNIGKGARRKVIQGERYIGNDGV